MIESYVPQVSSFAGDIDGLFTTIVVIVGFWYVLTNVMFFWLLFRYRARDGQKAQYVTGHEPELHRWVAIPHWLVIVCDVFLIVGAIRVWYLVKQDMPEPDQTVRIIAQQWAWTFVHPGPDGSLDTPDDISTIDEMHVQIGRTYHFELQSRDVLHSFSVPGFRLKQDAVPGRTIRGWFKPEREGEYDIQCAEMCGIGHGIMGARLFVEGPEQHSAWITAAAGGQLAAR